jgi:hypothetical protein
MFAEAVERSPVALAVPSRLFLPGQFVQLRVERRIAARRLMSPTQAPRPKVFQSRRGRWLVRKEQVQFPLPVRLFLNNRSERERRSSIRPAASGILEI